MFNVQKLRKRPQHFLHFTHTLDFRSKIKRVSRQRNPLPLGGASLQLCMHRVGAPRVIASSGPLCRRFLIRLEWQSARSRHLSKAEWLQHIAAQSSDQKDNDRARRTVAPAKHLSFALHGGVL
jgi:hypothetical protein